VRLSRNRNSEYLPQRRKDRKVRRLRVKIIYKSFCPPRNLGAFAPWREEFPTPSTFDARLLAQAAQIFNYSNTKATKGSNIYTLRLRALRVLGGKSVFSSWLRLAHAGAIAGFLLTGCTLGPDYLRPKVLVPDNYRGVTGAPAAESIADLPWWEVFKDQTLQELTREALSNNYDLQTAAARVEEARAQIGVARSFLYPQVDVRGGGSAQRVSRLSDPPQSFGANRNFQNWLLVFDMAWELDVFGRIRREAESATGVFLATEQAQRGVYITLVADVAQSYFILRELDLELEIGRRTLRVNDETIEFYRRRVFGGVSNQLELDQAVANRSRTASTIPEIERQIVTQENLINFLLGRNPGPVPRGAALTDQYYPPSIPAGLPSALLERRPDVKGAEDLLLATNADIGAAKALFFPNFSLPAALGATSHELSNLIDRRAAIASVAGGILQPVFQGWRIFYNYEATKARFDQALAQYQKAAQNGFREVADSLISVEKLKDVRSELEISVQSLANAARLSRLRYDTGLANYLEILIADQQLFDQELLLARTRGAQLTAVVQLYRALGGGWQP
jgi:outer membrane protein, multidrug efflux system